MLLHRVVALDVQHLILTGDGDFLLNNGVRLCILDRTDELLDGNDDVFSRHLLVIRKASFPLCPLDCTS